MIAKTYLKNICQSIIKEQVNKIGNDINTADVINEPTHLTTSFIN